MRSGRHQRVLSVNVFLIALLCGTHLHVAAATPANIRPGQQKLVAAAVNTASKANPANRALLGGTQVVDPSHGNQASAGDGAGRYAHQLQAHGRSLKIAWGVIFAGISALTGVATGINSIIQSNKPLPPAQQSGTTVEKCDNCCFGCEGTFNFGRMAGSSGPVPPTEDVAGPPPTANIHGCDNESCLCEAFGDGVHPNVFDPTCGTFFHCPGPKRECGPGTLYNAEINNCDYPVNVKCSAVKVPAA